VAGGFVSQISRLGFGNYALRLRWKAPELAVAPEPAQRVFEV